MGLWGIWLGKGCCGIGWIVYSLAMNFSKLSRKCKNYIKFLTSLHLWLGHDRTLDKVAIVY